ncbi:MAG: hypothetical protein ACI9BD_000686 [Candidatus Marinamargulisbacteria bacterium]|jgi:hypothetical protein
MGGQYTICMRYHKRVLWVTSILFRTSLRLIRDLDGLFSYFSAKVLKPKYEITGACKKRGVCCRNIAIYLSPSFWKYPLLVKLAVRWYTYVYNFSIIGQDPDLNVVLFSCNFLKDNTCTIYWKRPFICRNYPKPNRLFEKPTFMPGCGYRAFLRSRGNDSSANNTVD